MTDCGSMRRKSRRWPSWPATTAVPSTPTATTCECSSNGAMTQHVEVLKAKRPHIELYRGSMQDHGLAASTIDRRLSTVCGFFRFAHIDGRIPSNPAQYVRRPKAQPNEGHGMDRAELGTFLFAAERFDRDHAALAVLL